MEKEIGNLILKLKSGQGFKVGDVWIYFKKTKGDITKTISIAVVAPKNIRIEREERLEIKGPLYDPESYK